MQFLYSIAVFAAAVFLCAASPQQCALDDLGSQCGVKAAPATRDHVLLQLGASGGAAPGRKQAPAALVAIGGRETARAASSDAGGKSVIKEADARGKRHDDVKLSGHDELAFQRILKAEAKVEMKDKEDVAGGEREVAKTREVAHAVELDNKYGVSPTTDLKKHSDLLRKVLETFSESYDIDFAKRKGMVVSEEIVEQLNGESDTPETSNTVGSEGGDMVVGNPSHSTSWGDIIKRGDSINFCFASDIDRTIMEVFLHATAEYERLIPCIKFNMVATKNSQGQKSTDPDGGKECHSDKAIFVQSKENDGCHSEVGVMMQPATIINLAPKSCAELGTVLHELGHALGMGHEQARADRDKYVQVLWDNIPDDKKSNFDIEEGSSSGMGGLGYDANSIMGFGPSFFHKEKGLPTMKLIGNPPHEHLGQRMGLTYMDARKVEKKLGCPAAKHRQCSNVYAWHGEGRCSQESCVCHAHGTSVFKETDYNCHSCVEMCPSDNTCNPSGKCGCPPGLIRRSVKSAKDQTCYVCGVPEPTDTATITTMAQWEKELVLMPAKLKKRFRKYAKEALAEDSKITIERGVGRIRVITTDKKGKVTRRVGRWE